MKLRDLADSVYVPRRKLTHYALDFTSIVGRHKAIVFRSALGYTLENYQLLEAEIYRVSLDANASVIKVDQRGQHVRTDVEIAGVADQRALVRLGWLIPSSSREARLTTLLVKGK